ncbi:OmpP1/FadL family transporter [Photobacterium leiognathi]|uniref:OmpP1/FadL family transporter n=1 Tax=Photobacterium leiognathi TaxID=553611 RepID=UPI002980D7A9|nr:hypothetical protein [Photobacterium leiognathi]
MSRQIISFFPLFFSSSLFATGLSFSESSATNTALASANGAIALDASVLALAPSSITQLEVKNITAAMTQYSVTSDYEIFGKVSQYEKKHPIPSFFISSPLSHNFYAGFGLYSRIAADISVPEIGPSFLPLFYETRVSPIVLSAVPTLAYRWGTLSIAASIEYMHAEYELEQNRRRFGHDKHSRWKGRDNGWSGALSLTWKPRSDLSFALKHQYGSDFGDQQANFDLPSQTSFYFSWLPTDAWTINASVSETMWDGKGIHYSEYSDPFGLLVGERNSKRVAISSSYQWGAWLFMAGYSEDEVIDSLGGKDKRYRLGMSYKFNDNWLVTGAWLQEHFEPKEYNMGATQLVSVKNDGMAISVGVNYKFR